MAKLNLRGQSFCALVAFAPDWTLTHASENCAALLGRDLTQQIGAAMDAIFPSDAAHHLRSRAQVINHDTTAARVFAMDPFHDGLLFDVTVHAENGGYYFEFEPTPAPSPVRDETALVLRLVRRMRRARTQQAILLEATRGFRMLTGYRHVSLLREREGQTGTLLACDRARELPGLETEEGARCDLTQVAGRVSWQTALHLVADVQDDGAAIAPATPKDHFAESLGRMAAPAHQAWMQDLGLLSSLTVSIPAETEQRTIFVAYDTGPQRVDQHRRSAVELYVEFVGDELTRVALEEEISDLRMPLPVPEITMPATAHEAPRPFLHLVSDRVLDAALVVEDDHLIALETADMLSRAGARTVDSAATVDEALRCLQTRSYGFAVLDVKLAHGTTEELARELSRRKVPFALSTGMDPDDAQLAPYPDVPLLQKPMDLPQLQAVLTGLGLPVHES